MEMTVNSPQCTGPFWFMDIRLEAEPRVVEVQDLSGQLAVGGWVFPRYSPYLFWSGPIPKPGMSNIYPLKERRG